MPPNGLWNVITIVVSVIWALEAVAQFTNDVVVFIISELGYSYILSV